MNKKHFFLSFLLLVFFFSFNVYAKDNPQKKDSEKKGNVGLLAFDVNYVYALPKGDMANYFSTGHGFSVNLFTFQIGKSLLALGFTPVSYTYLRYTDLLLSPLVKNSEILEKKYSLYQLHDISSSIFFNLFYFNFGLKIPLYIYSIHLPKYNYQQLNMRYGIELFFGLRFFVGDHLLLKALASYHWIISDHEKMPAGTPEFDIQMNGWVFHFGIGYGFDF